MSEFEEIKKMDQINEKRPDFMPKIPNSIGIQPKKLFQELDFS